MDRLGHQGGQIQVGFPFAEDDYLVRRQYAELFGWVTFAVKLPVQVTTAGYIGMPGLPR